MNAHIDKLPTYRKHIDGGAYEVDLSEFLEVTIWCENSQAVWTELKDLRALVNRLEQLVVWRELL